MGGQPNRNSVRNLAYLALSETTKIPEQAGYVRCAACVITRGVSFIRVCSRRLVVPTQDMDFKARRVFFCPRCGVFIGVRARGDCRNAV